MFSVEKQFEIGPIRPPNEAGSLLIRISRNCSWNRCLFCPVYKREHFSRRTIAEIKNDIDTIAGMIAELKDISYQQGYAGAINREILGYVYQKNSAYFMVAHWLCSEEKSVFLQDADNMIYKADFLAECIAYLKEKIPETGRITTYARTKSVAGKTIDELSLLKKAGLSRVHIGLESGSATVLTYMRKGVTPEEHIEAGLKIKEAGLLLSEYIILGLGGQDHWQEHAIQTAAVLNRISPHFIRLRTLAVHPLTPLMQERQAGNFRIMSDEQIIQEEKMLIENLNVDEGSLHSDHILNLLEEVKGEFPADRKKMIAILDDYLSLPLEERELFRLGRRAGVYRYLDDRYDPYLSGKVDALSRELQKRGLTVDEFIYDLISRYL